MWQFKFSQFFVANPKSTILESKHKMTPLLGGDFFQKTSKQLCRQSNKNVKAHENIDFATYEKDKRFRL